MDTVVGVCGKLIGSLAVSVLIGLHEVGVVLVVGGERGHEQQALGKGGVEALDAQDAVHAVATHHLDLVAHIGGVLEEHRGRSVVDRGENHRRALFLGLGELVGEGGLRIVLEGLLVDDLELGLGSLLLERIGDAGRIGVAGVVEQNELLVAVVGSEELSSVNALVGVGEAHLEDIGLALGDVRGRSGRGDHEDLGILRCDLGHGNGSAGGGGADERLHAPVGKGIERGDGLLAVGDVIFALAHEVIGVVGEILAAELDAVAHGEAVRSGGTGLGTDGTNLELAAVGVGRCGAAVATLRGATG